MKLIVEWRLAIRKYWSFRFAILSALLSGLEVVVSLWQPFSIHPGIFAGLAGLAGIAAGFSRIVAQPKAWRNYD